jgi:Tfp pilus assembly protein FimT
LTGFANSQELLYVYFTKRQSDKATKRQSDKATKRQSVKSKNKSFTLVEIVFTIVIIGILLAIFLPVMSSIKLSAQKVKDVSNLKAIAAAWRECVINRGWIIDGHANNETTRHVSRFIQQLAGLYQSNISNIVLNNFTVYISPNDKYASKVQRESLSFVQSNGAITFYSDVHSRVSNFMVNNSFLFSYCFILNLPSHAPLDTTPLGFTRGLNKNGLWDEKSGLYGSKGGYVVFCDGHTTWFDGSKPAKFLKWDQSGYTTDIRQAMPKTAWISCTNPSTAANGDLKAAYDGENALAILSQAGTGED